MSRDRATFIQLTYMHLAGAILAFIGLEALLLYTFREVGERLIMTLFANGPVGMLVVLVAFIAVSYIAQMWARSETSQAVQYLGLGLYVVAEAVIILPLLWIVIYGLQQPQLVYQAGILTLALFAGLTVAVFATGKDFSFLGPILSIGCMLALGVIIAGLIFNFTLGLFFCLAMVALLAGMILYDTGNILHHYNTNQYVAAALALFASVATLFWYILRILIILNSNRD